MRLDEALELSDRLVTDMRRTGTLVVTLYGGPGSGKSTTRAEVFANLKKRNRNAEEAPEYAKELVWEQATGKLGFQPYIIAKQMWRIKRLDGQVEVIITDTSTLLSLIYGTEENGVTPAFREWVLDEYKSRNTLDFFLHRDPKMAYNPEGRTQKSLEEATKADREIIAMLNAYGIQHNDVTVSEHNTHVEIITGCIEQILDLSGPGGVYKAQNIFNARKSERFQSAAVGELLTQLD